MSETGNYFDLWADDETGEPAPAHYGRTYRVSLSAPSGGLPHHEATHPVAVWPPAEPSE